MNIAVLDAATLGEDLDLSALKEFGRVSVYPMTAPDQVADRIADADIILINKIVIRAQTLEHAARLRMIAIAATGFDNVDLEACRSRGIAVTNVVGYSTHSVAQLTVATVLSLACHLRTYHAFVASGEYTASGIHNRLSPVYHELYGRTWGVLGYGHIGQQVARVAEALGCRILACKRTPVEGVACVNLDTLCAESDILSVHTPLTDDTRHMIGAREIGLMRPHIILYNGARGAVVDEKAVADAVRSERIFAFGTDVYSREPLAQENPIWEIKDHPRVLLTPHMAWGAYEARCRCLQEMILNIRAFLKGERRCRVES